MLDSVSDETVFQLEKFLPHRLSIASDAVWRVLARACGNQGLTRHERLVILALGEEDAATAKAVGLRCHIDKAGMSRTVATLLARGLIIRTLDQLDRRKSRLSLSPAGRKVHQDCVGPATDLATRLMDGFSIEEREALERCLKRLARKSQELFR